MATTRGKNYNDEELKQVCYSFLHVSQDPCVGNGQRAERFWDRVQEHYNKHKPAKTEARGKKSLEGKWGELKHDVSKFVGCMATVEGRQTSGTNEADTLQAARELFKENHKKNRNFSFEPCYWILKDVPRWCNPNDDHMAKGKTKRSVAGKENGSPNAEVIEIDTTERAVDGETESAETSASKRPKGNKSAKEELKRQKQQEDALAMTALAQKEMANANLQRARVMENNSSMALLSLPTDNMSPNLVDFINSWKLEEAIKLKKRMDLQHLNQEKQSEDQQQSTTPTSGFVETPPCVRQPLFPPTIPNPTPVQIGEDDEDEWLNSVNPEAVVANGRPNVDEQISPEVEAADLLQDSVGRF